MENPKKIGSNATLTSQIHTHTNSGFELRDSQWKVCVSWGCETSFAAGSTLLLPSQFVWSTANSPHSHSVLLQRE